MKRTRSYSLLINEKTQFSNENNERKSTLYEFIKNNFNNNSKRNFIFILFNNEFYNNYFNDDKIKLFLINEKIFICIEMSEKLEEFKNKEIKKFDNLNNLQLLEKLENDIINFKNRKFDIYYYNKINIVNDFDYFQDQKNSYENQNNEINYLYNNKNKKSNYIYRQRSIKKQEIFNIYYNIDILNRLELKTLDETFFKKWMGIKNDIFTFNKSRYNLQPNIVITKKII